MLNVAAIIKYDCYLPALQGVYTFHICPGREEAASACDDGEDSIRMAVEDAESVGSVAEEVSTE